MAFGPLNFQRVPCLTAQTVDETTGPSINVLGYTALTFYVIGTGTIASGVITFEEADINPSKLAAEDYAGMWSEIGTVNAADVTGGAQLAYHVGGPGGLFAYSFVRARISTAIGGGGDISVVLVAV